MTLKKTITIVIFFLFSLGCRVTLVPDYNSELEGQIAQTAMLNDKLYLDLLNTETSKTEFGNFADRYSDIEAGINSIKLQNLVRKNNMDMIAIIDTLKSHFEKLKTEHKNSNKLSPGEIKANEATIQGFWQPLLAAEHALKSVKSAK